MQLLQPEDYVACTSVMVVDDNSSSLSLFLILFYSFTVAICNDIFCRNIGGRGRTAPAPTPINYLEGMIPPRCLS